MIHGVNQVVLEVEDQDRALEFWSERLGFELAQDASYGDERWVEVRAPDKAVLLVLSLRHGERPTAPEMLPTSNVHFYCDDLTATYEELRRPRRRVPAAASGAALGLVVNARRSGGEQVRADPALIPHSNSRRHRLLAGNPRRLYGRPL